MISINDSFFINGLQSMGSALKTLVKSISSFLSKLSYVTNAGDHSSDTQMLFQNRNQPMEPHTKLIANLEQAIKEDKQSPDGAAWYARYNSTPDHSAKIRRTPVPSLSSIQITKPEKMIENDQQSSSNAIISSGNLQVDPEKLRMALTDFNQDPEIARAKWIPAKGA